MAGLERLAFVSLLVSCVFVLALGEYTLLKVEVPLEDESLKVFTVEDIKVFDGRDGGPLYMAVKGVVFDVSEGESFYGPDAPYNALTGKDCSRAVAKMSLEPEDLVPDLSDLNETYLRSLDTVYTGTYKKKYPVVGYMDYLVEQARREAQLRASRDDL